MHEGVRRDDGVMLIDNQGYRFSLFIPSRKRADRVTKHPLFHLANIIVHEDEYDDYARAFQAAKLEPGSLLTHNVVGLSRIHNVMLDYYRPTEEAWQWHTDDDYAGFMFTHTFRATKIKTNDPEKVVDIVTHVGIAATDADAPMFCWAQSAIPHERHAFNPFEMRGWGMSACMGIIKTDVRFDENLPISIDIDYCLANIAKHRYIWIDRRWWGWCDEKRGRTGSDPGGLAGIRLPGTTKFAHEYLGHKWGDDVVNPAQGKKRGQGITLRVKIPK